MKDGVNDVSPQMHWLGRPIKELPASYARGISKQFNIIECGDNVSILSDPNVHVCIFFVGGSNPISSQCISTLCKNLTKRLIVLITKDSDADLPEPSITQEVYTLEPENLSEDHFSTWLSNVQQKYFSLPSQKTEPKSTPELTPKQNSNHEPNVIPDDLLKVLEFIESNINKEIREEEMAALCHYSTTYFSRYFHKHMQVCFRDFLIDQRLTLAKQLLKDQPKLKIAYIAYQCGYQDISYFARIFKKRIGLSPAAYRQHILKAD